MRLLEIVLLISVTLIPFIKRPLLGVLNAKYIHAGLIVVLVSHLIIDGWRWQMIPAYLLLVILIWRILTIKNSSKKKLSFIKFLGFFLLSIIILTGWVLPYFLPVFNLPETTGAYKVGSHWLSIKTDQDEYITNQTDDKRELMVKVWYPTNNISSVEEEPYVDEANRIGFINKYNMGILPASSINYLDRIKTNVYMDAPIAEGEFPVLVFSPGYGSMSTGYYSLLTELVSQGYIIFNISHPYESLGTTFPDGSVKLFDYSYAEKISKDTFDEIKLFVAAFHDDTPFEVRHELAKKAIKKYFVKDIVNRWSDDIITVIDQFEIYNQSGFLMNTLDLNKIGTFGHSRGGGAAGKAVISDNRIKAVANIDGIQWGDMIDTIYQKPFLFISSDWPASHEDVNPHVFINKSTSYFYESKILNSGHSNFMDIPFMVPLKSLSEAGQIDPELGIKITRELLVSFFDRHLMGSMEAAPYLIEEQYELLEMSVFKGDSIE